MSGYISRDLSDYWLNPAFQAGSITFASHLIGYLAPSLNSGLIQNSIDITSSFSLSPTVATFLISYIGSLIGQYVSPIQDTSNMTWYNFLVWEAKQTLIMTLIDAGLIVTLQGFKNFDNINYGNSFLSILFGSFFGNRAYQDIFVPAVFGISSGTTSVVTSTLRSSNTLSIPPPNYKYQTKAGPSHFHYMPLAA